MDFNDPKQRQIFFEVHDDLPRQGPGNRACAERALKLAGDLPKSPRILDIACGPGMQTMYLAEMLPHAQITAVDAYPPFIDEVRARAKTQGCADRVTAAVSDMSKLEFPEGSFDFIWCEGAAYIMGVENALRGWKPLLASGGKLALSEAVWLKQDPPKKVRLCWEEYPDMKDAAFNRNLVEQCGYRLLGDFILPEEAWWDDYYIPIEERLNKIGEKYKNDPVAQQVIDECQLEVDVYRQYSDYYSYIFLVMTV